MKFVFGFIFFFFAFLFSSSEALAQTNFSSTSNILYTASDTGNTHVLFQITLTNTTSQFYASSYKFNVGFNSIKNVTAKDPSGNLSPHVTKTKTGYNIDTQFKSRVVGIGKSFIFTVEFDTPDIVSHLGNIWEVNIPGLTKENDFSNFTISVAVPPVFGSPTFIKPTFVPSIIQDNGKLVFTKDQLHSSGISVTYGKKQITLFSLKYHLKNGNLFPITSYVTLPPDTNYQKVFITDISETPKQVSIDPDGNWVLEFPLSINERKNITVKGYAVLLLNPNAQDLSNAEEKEYIKYLTLKKNLFVQELLKTKKETQRKRR